MMPERVGYLEPGCSKGFRARGSLIRFVASFQEKSLVPDLQLASRPTCIRPAVESEFEPEEAGGADLIAVTETARWIRTMALEVTGLVLPHRVLTVRNSRATYVERCGEDFSVTRVADARVVSARGKHVLLSKEEGRHQCVLGLGEGGDLSRKQRGELPTRIARSSLEVAHPVAISDAIYPTGNIYHLYVNEMLPYLFLTRMGLLDKRTSLLVVGGPTEYQKSLMGLLDIPWVEAPPGAVLKDVTVMHQSPSLTRSAVQHFRTFRRSVLLRHDLPVNAEDGERLYIARRHRFPRQQPLIAKVAASFGYKLVFLEDLSFRDQIAITAGSAHWIADHGAAEVHLLWATLSSLIEITPRNANGSLIGSDCYGSLLSDVTPQALYNVIPGTTPVKSGNRLLQRRRHAAGPMFEVSVSDLRELLTDIHSS